MKLRLTLDLEDEEFLTLGIVMGAAVKLVTEDEEWGETPGMKSRVVALATKMHRAVRDAKKLPANEAGTERDPGKETT